MKSNRSPHPYQAILAKWMATISEESDSALRLPMEIRPCTPDEVALSKELDGLAQELGSISLSQDLDVDFDVDRFLRNVDEMGTSGGEGRAGQNESPLDTSPFEDLEFFEWIGRGSYGDVFRAYWTKHSKEVAVKRLRCELGPEQRSRFQREWRIQKKLAHPNILETYELRESADDLYMLVELIEGWTLKKIGEKHAKLEFAVVQGILLQLAGALSHAHQCGVVHRDLKPSNVMLDRFGRVVILDFGLASLRYSESSNLSLENVNLTSQGRMMGSVDYISPEQIEDARLANASSDLYSLACMAYFLLSGNPPFPHSRFPAEAARLMAHCSLIPTEVITLREDTPSRLNEWIQRALSKSIELRPSLCELQELIEESDPADAVVKFAEKNIR